MRFVLTADTEQDALVAADLDGDGFDDETGEPVDDEDAEPTDDEDAATMEGLLRRVLTVEDTWTGDRRFFEAGSFTWAALPLPYMATDTTTEMHLEARLVGHIERAERVGSDIVGYVSRLASDDPEVRRLQDLVWNDELPGTSVDMDSMVGRLVFPDRSDDEAELIDDEPDAGPIEIPFGGDDDVQVIVEAARIIGATAVPFPALQETRDDSPSVAAAALVAGAGSVTWFPANVERSLVAAIEPPSEPPEAWFTNPGLTEPTRLTATDEGRVFGHLAMWGTCHVGFPGECVEPPPSANEYASFHTGELVTAEGTRVAVGQITTGSGHADDKANPAMAKEHYDHTGWAAADVCCGEDEHGIWMAGAMRPGLNPARVREFMAADVSGDWRRISGHLELVGVASVNVPGFPKPTPLARVASGRVQTLVLPAEHCPEQAGVPGWELSVRETLAASVGLHPAQRLAQRDSVAASVGLSRTQRRERLAADVRG